MKVTVDRSLCVGIGNCSALSPKTFKIDTDNKIGYYDVPTVTKERVINAAKSCPVMAITIEDDDGRIICP